MSEGSEQNEATENVDPQPTAGVKSADSGAGGRKTLRIFGHGVAVSSTALVLLVIFAAVLATTVGVIAVHAATSGTASPSPTGQASTGSSSSSSSTTTTSTTLPGPLAAGPDQSHAPAFPTAGGGQPAFGDFNALTCASSTRCFAVGVDDQGNGVASTSSDGGSTWDSLTLPTGTPVLDAVACADASHCIAVGQGAVAVTTDQGSQWSLEPLPLANTTLIGADCPSTSLCVVAGVTNNPTGPYAGAVLRSTDGGTTWQSATVPPGTLGIGDVACPTSTDCIAIGASLLVSHNGGATWSSTTVPGGTGPLRSISCSSATQCVAIGANPQGLQDPAAPAVAVETSDGGDTWTSLSLPAGSAPLNEVSCSTGTQCVAGGSSPTPGGAAPLFQSSDGGVTWTQDASPPPDISAIAGLSCPAANQCAIVGRQLDRTAATAASSDLSTWSTTTLPGNATPPSTDAIS